jgi:uncharacterized membrane protein
LFTRQDLGYLVWLSAPLAGLYLLSSPLALVALPQLLANALSDSPATVGPQHQYIAAMIPFLISATVLGIARLSPERRTFCAVLVLTLSGMLLAFAGPWRGALAAVDLWYQTPVPDARVSALREAIELVPRDARVSATNKAGSHLSGRRHVYSVPAIDEADWVVLDMEDHWLVGNSRNLTLGPYPERLEEIRKELLAKAAWRKVYDAAGVLVFRRSGSS